MKAALLIQYHSEELPVDGVNRDKEESLGDMDAVLSGQIPSLIFRPPLVKRTTGDY